MGEVMRASIKESPYTTSKNNVSFERAWILNIFQSSTHLYMITINFES